ncbi:hypothetical protein DXG01_015515 [Tephrocybe rancida]|nr:hypothetical protein DXG01_015515 [Tephrocybe rancida]
MRFLTIVFSALAVSLPAFAAPATLLRIEKFNGPTSGRYIVRLKPDTAKASFLKAINTNPSHNWNVINGFAGKFSTNELDALRAHPDVESISEDGIMSISTTQTNAPWGLARLTSSSKLVNQDPSALTYTYNYEARAGAGVDIYVLDLTFGYNQSQFGGRARWGATFGDYSSADGNGHGTHCAGTAAGSQYGVAKAASIIAVKVLADNGRPTVVSMSLGGDAYTPVDDAVASLTASGIHVIVSAGNDNKDAITASPARAPSAITVGASNVSDARAWFSNYGQVVDIFAPGQNITSAWIDGPTSSKSISGTSMAAPHISGLVAYLISLQGNLRPAAMEAKVKRMGTDGVLTNIRKFLHI